MSTLYNLTEEVGLIVDADLPDAEKAAILDGYLSTGDAPAKVDAYCRLIRNLETQAEARKTEADRLSALAKAVSSEAAFRKACLYEFLKRTGRDKLETERFKVGIVKNGGKVPVEYHGAIEDLPEEYLRVTFAADMDRLREALEAGEEINGAKLGERGTRLSIR